MNIRKKFVAILFGLTLIMTVFGVALPKTIATTPTSAAISVNFSYSAPQVTASGVLVTNGNQITGITGTRNGVAIDSLLPPDYQMNRDGIDVMAGLGNDNLLQPSSPQLNERGFSYTAGGLIYNVYYSSGGYYEVSYPILITKPLTSFSTMHS